MRIVFIGAVDFSLHTLTAVLRTGGRVVGVFTLPLERAAVHADFADLEPIAAASGIPVHRVERINDPTVLGLIRDLRPDVIFVFGFSQLLSRTLLDIPPLGVIGTHPSLLPRNRGRHPLIWTLIEGLDESGLTFFFMSESADAGDILWQRAFAVTIDDDAGTLYQRIKDLSSVAIAEWLPQLESGTYPRVPQDESKATWWRRRSEADGAIDWSRPAADVHNLIRGLTAPYVGAHTFLGDHRVVVWRSRLTEPQRAYVRAAPGEIVAESPAGVLVQAGDGPIELLQWDTTAPALAAGMRLGG